VRVNPGNIKEFDGRVKEVAKAAATADYLGSLSSGRDGT
jgi:4-hydroxy-3-methylbut-2-en-1-yl diphosphate synthase IspG/GcpE